MTWTTRHVPTSLTPTQNFTWLMRFSPHGSLLALAGLGQIELWDPVAHSLVNQLPNSEQASDVAFSPDGHTLGRGGPRRGDLGLDGDRFGDADAIERVRRAAIVAGLQP